MTADTHAELDASIEELVPLVETSLAMQEEIHAFRERYDQLGRDAPLPPRSLRKLQDGRRRYLNLQKRLTELATRYDPETIDPAIRFDAVSVSLLAGVTVYDNFLSMLTILKDDRLRRLLNDPDYGYGIGKDALWKIVEDLNSASAQKRLGELIDAWTGMQESGAQVDGVSALLCEAIRSSVSFRYAEQASLEDHLPGDWTSRRVRFRDAMSGLASASLGAISKAFGNGIGLVETRKGKLWRRPEVREHLLGVLRPLDLLLEKTPFRLTDHFIPGHFGHVAIWMGSDAQLDGLGLWSRPEMQQERLQGDRARIRDGHCVLEALRTGVVLSTLEHFLNVDDVAVLRPKNLSEREVAESLVRGFRQVGKEYDFNFDVETTGSIVCSELPYHVYPGVHWQTSAQLGRFTISPDQVASQALSEDGAFDLVVLYHDGGLVDPAEALPRMETLTRNA